MPAGQEGLEACNGRRGAAAVPRRAGPCLVHKGAAQVRHVLPKHGFEHGVQRQPRVLRLRLGAAAPSCCRRRRRALLNAAQDGSLDGPRQHKQPRIEEEEELQVADGAGAPVVILCAVEWGGEGA
jgi:hypothetical protein